MIRKSAIIFFLITYFGISTAIASEKSILDRITHKIVSIKNLISRDTSKRQKLQNELAQTETSSGLLSKQLNTTYKKLTEQKALYEELKNNEKNFETKLTTQKELLDLQIQMAYMLGREPYIKLLLNQENSSEMNRIFMYYHFINQSRLQAINDIQETLKAIKQSQEKIQIEYQTLQKLEAQQKNEKSQLVLTQEKRKTLLTVLNKNIQTRQQRLNELVANKHRLENTLKQVAHQTTYAPEANFSKLAKHLSWPTRGQVLPLFGTQIEQSELRWGGLLIKAPEGQPVYAVAPGKVVFAKWLSGYGLLLIINHGNGYMTLYGRNHALYKNEGDLVKRGDLVATVGQTGGYESPALYFAVRHNGNPINPELFIRKEST